MAFSEERTIKSVRKARPCCACNRMIEVGSPAVDWSGTHEGDFCHVSYHADCRAAEVAVNTVNQTFWDEWIGLQDLETDDYPLIIQDFPEVAGRLGINPKPEGEG